MTSCRWPHPGILIVALLLLPACGKKLRFNEARLQKKCDVPSAQQVTEKQARCIARVAGLRDRKKCPLELTEVAGETGGTRAYRLRESCSTVGIEIDRSTGRVVGVAFREAQVESR